MAVQNLDYNGAHDAVLCDFWGVSEIYFYQLSLSDQICLKSIVVNFFGI